MVALIAQALWSLQPVTIPQLQAATVRGIFKRSSFLLPERHFYTYAFRTHAELDTCILCRILHYSSGDNPPPLPHTQQLKKNLISICKRRLSFTPQFKTLSLIYNQSFFHVLFFFLSFFHHYPRRLSYVSTIIIIFYPQGLLPPSPNVFSVFGWQPQHMYTLRWTRMLTSSGKWITGPGPTLRWLPLYPS